MLYKDICILAIANQLRAYKQFRRLCRDTTSAAWAKNSRQKEI